MYVFVVVVVCLQFCSLLLCVSGIGVVFYSSLEAFHLSSLEYFLSYFFPNFNNLFLVLQLF